MNEMMPVGQDRAESFALTFEHARNDILERFAPMAHTIHGVGIGHTNTVNAGAFTHDGSGLLTASWDGTAILWDTKSGLPVRRFVGHEGPLRALCLTSEGTTFVTGGDDCTARMWDMNSGQCLHVFRGHRGTVACVYATADGRELLTAGRDATAMVWDMGTMGRAKVLKGHRDNVSCVCLSRDVRHIITASFDKNVHVWDRASGRLLKVLPGEYAVNWICTTPKDQILAAYADNSCWLWTMDGRRIDEYHHHRSAMLRCVAEKKHWFGRAKGFIDSDNVRENATILHSITSCSSVAAPMHDPYYFSTGWDGTCRQIAYNGQEIRCLKGHEHPVERVVLSRDDNTLATLGWDARAVLWDIRTGSRLKTLCGFTHPVMGMALSPAGDALATTGGGRIITVWDLSQGHARLSLSNPADQTVMAYSPAGDAILTAGSDGDATLWDADTGVKRSVFRCGDPVSRVAFSSDGRMAALACFNGQLSLYNLEHGFRTHRLAAFMGGVSCLAFTPDSLRLMAGAGDRTVRMFDVKTGREMACLRHKDEVRSMGLDKGGSTLATGSLDGVLCIWNLRQGVRTLSIQAHQGGINGVLFGSGERQGTILTAGDDGLVRLWDLNDRVCAAVGRGHLDKVFCIALSPCGRFLFSGGQDHTVRCWDLGSPEIEQGTIPLLASMVHLQEGFLWTTPPAPTESAPSGWFWTDRKDLIVVSRTGDGVLETVVGEKERDEYISLYCRKEMVMSRLSAPEKYAGRVQQLRYALHGRRARSLSDMRDSLVRRLGFGGARAAADQA